MVEGGISRGWRREALFGEYGERVGWRERGKILWRGRGLK